MSITTKVSFNKLNLSNLWASPEDEKNGNVIYNHTKEFGGYTGNPVRKRRIGIGMTENLLKEMN